MKRTLFFVACVQASLAMPAQENSYFDYVPFVEMGKQWHVIRSNFGEPCHFDTYTMNEEVVKAGKTYLKMYRHEDFLDVVYDAGLLREEDRKVYKFDTDTQKEYLLFDYSLKAGDTYEAYSVEYQEMVKYEVLSVSFFTDGPEVIRKDYDEKADSMTTRHRYLRKWVVASDVEQELCLEPKTWIEGVGSLEGPFANLYDASPVSSMSYLAYVYDNSGYYPFSFYDSLNRNLHGCNLPTRVEYQGEDDRHQLTYELEGNRLFVYGKVFTQCGPNNYAYFFEEPTDDPLVHKLRFVIEEVEPLADCRALHATYFYVPGFDPNMNYIVVDNQGEEHPVINKTPQMAYRPFIEDGKVWKLGAEGSGNPVQWVECFYFDGDTIIDGRTCKQMMCQRYVNPDYISQDYSLSYLGAWYEEDQKVYAYDTTNKQFELMYDFSINAYDTLLIDNLRYVFGPRQTGGAKGFKGVYRDVWMSKGGGNITYSTPWLEGVGGIYGPTINVIDGELADPMWFLMSCAVGDEVIYLNDDYEDGATPAEARKERFDFTHTIKTRPKAPRRAMGAGEGARVPAEAEPSLYGEYNEQQLGIRLDPLDEVYLVRITDESGKAIYEKAVNAGSIVGLNIDISAYAEGRYTVTVENSRESYFGEFEIQTTGIDDVKRLNDNGERKNNHIYNLQGQRIRSLQKGLNIVNGQKVCSSIRSHSSYSCQ
ncbi:MAG: hypothetical protein J6Z14_10270 [Prevotella sp.]|nr:hypothetical protein [Prevotella sp.]